MYLLKYIGLVIIQISICAVCFAQRNAMDSLKKQLPSLQDTARIGCLNNLSHAYIQLEKKDSAEQFANLALDESKNINYNHGIAVSYLRYRC